MRISSLSLTVLSILAAQHADTVVDAAFVSSAAAAATAATTPTALMSSSSPKDGFRARVEKNFEDMMDNDWRYFRARLVMQEAMEEEQQQQQAAAASAQEAEGGMKRQKKKHQQQQQRTLATTARSKAAAAAATSSKTHKAQHEQLGEFFADAISNIFSKNPKTTATTTAATSLDAREMLRMDPILDGDSIAGLLPLTDQDSIQDPFITAGELPVMMAPRVNLSKQRWAHPITHIEPGCVLLASEKLAGAFRQAVILIIDHNDSAGSLGIVINRPMKGDLFKIASDESEKSHIDLSLKLAFKDSTVSYGGPVMPEDFTILHGYGEVEGAKKVAPGVFVGGSEELMHEVRQSRLRPTDTLFVKGHAAWVPNQLATEVSRGVWYVASTSKDFVLRHAKGAPPAGSKKKKNSNDSGDLWLDILTCMGGKYAQVAQQFVGTTGGAGDNSQRKMTP